MYPHRIRLRGPWECEPLAVAEPCRQPLPSPCRMTLPGRWSQGGLPGFAGRARFRRRFGFPGRLDAFERVWLTVEGADARAEVWLNGQFLGRHDGPLESFEFEVTSMLLVRNELIVELEGPAETGGLWGEVALEVRCTAYLRGVRLWADIAGDSAIVHAAGELIGNCDRPLELYLLLDGSTVAYTTLEATAMGRRFQLDSEELGPERRRPRGDIGDPPHVVRVDLVNGATIWHMIEQPFAFDEAGRS